MKSLVSVAQDDTLSRRQRLIAVKELQDTFPAYFGNLKTEEILNGNVTGAVNEVSKALIARATASALAGKLGELASKRLELEVKREKDILDIQKQQAYIKKKYEEGGSQTKGISFEEYQRINLKSLSNQYKETQKSIADIDAQSKKYSERENKATADAILLLEKKDKVLKTKATKTFDTPQVSGASSLIPIDLVVSPINTAPIATAFTGIREVVGQEMIATMELLYNFNNDVNDLVTGSLTSTFDTLGASIGEALSTGGNVFQAIGNSLLASLGAFISDMGGLLIKYGVLAVAKGQLDIAIATGGPIAVGAGIAAIAVGIALKAVGGAISAKAKGGQKNTSSSTGSNANNSSSTSTSGYSGGSGYGTVVFEIAGTSLIGVLNNTTDRNLRIGGRT